MTTIDLSRDEIIARNVAAVENHFHDENPEGIRRALELYTDDITWEVPARGILLHGKEAVYREYVAIFGSAQGLVVRSIRRFGTERYVFDDSIATFTVTGPGWRNCPFPIGTKVSMRLTHIFELRDGKICRENGYEIWRRAEDSHLINDDA